MGFRRHPSDEAEDLVSADPYGEALARFSPMAVPERAAEVLAGIAATLEADTSYQYKQQRKLLDVWFPEPQGRWPDSAMPLWRVLSEAFTALVLARLVIQGDDGRDSGGSLTFYWLSDDGRAALERGDVAAGVRRRLPS